MASPVASTGRPPFAHKTTLRIHYLQYWFGLSDLAMEEALFVTPLHRDFAGPSCIDPVKICTGVLPHRFWHTLTA